jgi:hypothetical protein
MPIAKRLSTISMNSPEEKTMTINPHGEHIHQIYRDVDVLNRGIPGAVPMQEVTKYIDQFLKEGWNVQHINMLYSDVGEDRRAPQPVLRLLYVLVKP